MESALCLRYRPLPVPKPLLHLPSAVSATRATILMPHFSFRHCSLSLSNGSMRRRLGHVLSPATCMLNGFPRPSKSYDNEGDNDKVVRGAMGASLVLACVLGIISGSCMMNHKAIASHESKTAPISDLGKMEVIKSLFRVKKSALASIQAQPPARVTPNGQPLNYAKKDTAAIQEVAMELMNSGKVGEAEACLKTAHEQKMKHNDPDSAYVVEMALVEVLIFQGKYEEALTCKCLQNIGSPKSDTRIPLYKAIIHTMLKDRKNAEKWWGIYFDAIEVGIPDPRMK